MDLVKCDRRALALTLTRLQQVIASYDVTAPPPFPEITTQEAELLQVKLKCTALIERTSALAKSDAEFLAEGAEFVVLEDQINKANIKLAIMKNSYATARGAGSVSIGGADVKLPKIEIPAFKGDTQDWLSFQDLFISSIHSNGKLSGSQKLQYLKGLLQGEPASLIKDIPVTDASYDQAWDILKARYEVKRDIIRSHFDRLLSLQTIQQSNPVLLRKIGDSTNECNRALEVLKLTPEQRWDSILIHLMSRKLDTDSRVEWEKKLAADELPSISKFTDFIISQARATAAGGMKPKQSATKSSGTPEKKSVHLSNTENKSSKSCLVESCESIHFLHICEKFREFTIDERWDLVKKAHLCANCFRNNHKTHECPSKYTCKNCHRKHHTLLHKPEWQSSTSSTPTTAKKSEQTTKPDASLNNNFAMSGSAAQVLLSTALIRVKDSRNNFQVCRALLDDGSQASFVTTKCATRLGLHKINKSVQICGVGGIDAGRTTQCASLHFTSCHNSRKSFSVDAYLQEKLTGNLPSYPVHPQTWPHVENLQLADPKFYEPGKIDILLGRDVYDDLVLSRKMKGSPGNPTARETVLGWILGGPVRPSPLQSYNHLVTNHTICDLDAKLQKFWELEEVPSTRLQTPEEIECEQHFASTHFRDSTGRFVVRLPFKRNTKEIGESRTQALRRLKSGERSRSIHPSKQIEYNTVLEEYLTLNHMEKVPAKEVEKSSKVYYIPHHSVYKPSSTTTKVRVVFDASAKSSNGVSLNDNLLIGPKLQEDIFSILVRFRTHQIAFTADIAKMYRQVQLHPEDCDFQRILWRKSPEDPISDYRLTTATFGTAAAPYLAIKCLQQIALDEISTNQNCDQSAATTILKDFYVDDLMSGSPSDTEAIKKKDELLRILAARKMELRKWSSNSNALLESLPSELRETKFPLQIEEDDSVKTLGLTWTPASDLFSISVVMPPTRETITRRSLLSDVAKTFDPLGLLSPATIKAKLILQSLWKEKQDWDEPIPPKYKQDWLEYLQDFPNYNQLTIPRCITMPASDYELHGFCDASQVAYAACVYLRSLNSSDEVQVRLISSKTKVAPISYVSVARLELCGATLLSKLMEKVKSSLELPISKVTYWSDSTIVLSWIASPSSRWKIFVANRVAKIQETSSAQQWNHVRGEENPADCASRGINPSTLMTHTLWWTGPQWLQSPILTADVISPEESAEAAILEEERKIVTSHHISSPQELLEKCSSLLQLQRVTALLLRVFRLKSFKTPGPLTVPDLRAALEFWIRKVQMLSFKETISAIKKSETIPSSGKQLKGLSPFLDNSGILRVGGRLQNSNLTPDRKHPILLPKKSRLTILIVEHYHKTLGHAGNQLLLASLQSKYWILGARDIIRYLIRKCIPCHRVRAETAQQMMGNLPAPRVNQTRPFQTCGVDFAGPFQLLLKRGRGQKSQKFYVAVFICFVVRAIHLELVSDLTTEAFLAAFRRFVSRRGLCTDVYSDCGTNFVGACAELKTYLRNIQSSTLGAHLKESLAKDGITWHFNPPSSPHFGGLWEAGVKSFKYHLKRIVGNHTLTSEEMLTVLAQIEACLNSRPLTALSTDPNDLTALTPGNFLVGDALLAIPEPDVTDLKSNSLSRWQLTQQFYQHFWHRWSSEYLSRLQQRPKWWSEKKNIEIGDLVLLKDERLPSLKWKLGRVQDVFPGKDDLVRAVSVKTSDGIFTRPIAKLCPIPIESPQQFCAED